MRIKKKKMTLSPNEMTPYIRKIQQKSDEAQMFIMKITFTKPQKVFNKTSKC